MAVVSYDQQLPRVAFQLRQSKNKPRPCLLPTSMDRLCLALGFFFFFGKTPFFYVDQRSRVCVEMQLSNLRGWVGGRFSLVRNVLYILKCKVLLYNAL